jgi:hypothetical protein
MTFKITSLREDKNRVGLTENIYYVNSVDIEEAITMFEQKIKNNKPSMIEYITKIERLDHITILT